MSTMVIAPALTPVQAATFRSALESVLAGVLVQQDRTELERVKQALDAAERRSSLTSGQDPYRGKWNGKRLEKWREEMGWTQHEAAAWAADSDLRSWQRWEYDERRIPRWLIRLMRAEFPTGPGPTTPAKTR